MQSDPDATFVPCLVEFGNAEIVAGLDLTRWFITANITGGSATDVIP